MPLPYENEVIRIGTLAGQGMKTAAYIRQIIPHGFESFQVNFWQSLSGVNLKKLGRETLEALDGSGAIISSLGMFGNPLETSAIDRQTLRGWQLCIDNAHHFGTDLVCGFTGRVRGKSIPESIPRFKKVFGDLAKRAADKGVRLAFENCWMDGTWKSGDWNIAVNPDAWELMFDAVPAENLGLEWEPCHQLCELIDPMPQLRSWVPKIFHVHGKDATVYHDVIAKHGFNGSQPAVHHRHPGFGDSNWTDIISELRRHGFKGCIDIEGWHDPVYRSDLEMTGQVAALNYLKRCRGGSFVANPKV
ncbi:sugar phosphate isomerase/epimerase [soil metagenome]